MTSPIQKPPARPPATPVAGDQPAQPVVREWCCGTPITGPHIAGCAFEPKPDDGVMKDALDAAEAQAPEPPASDPVTAGPAPAASVVPEDLPYGFRKAEEFDFITPNGDKVRLRKLRRTQVFKMKLYNIGDSFGPELLKGINPEDEQMSDEDAERAVKTVAALTDNPVFDRVIVAALICPKVTLGDPVLDEIELEDKIAIFNAVMPAELQQAALEAQQDELKSVRTEPAAGL